MPPPGRGGGGGPPRPPGGGGGGGAPDASTAAASPDPKRESEAENERGWREGEESGRDIPGSGGGGGGGGPEEEPSEALEDSEDSEASGIDGRDFTPEEEEARAGSAKFSSAWMRFWHTILPTANKRGKEEYVSRRAEIRGRR